MSNLSQLKDTNIRKHLKAAFAMLESTTYAAPEKVVDRAPTIGRRSVSSLATSSSASSFSILENLKSLTIDNPLMTDVQHHIATIIQESISVAAEIAETYEELSGLKAMRLDNSRGILSAEQKAQYNDVKKTHAYITVLTAANYVQAKLTDGNTELVNTTMTAPNLSDSLTATKSFLYNINEALLSDVKDESKLESTIKAVALAFIDSLRPFESSLLHTAPILGNSYRSEMLDFNVTGFELSGSSKKQTLVMQFKEPEEVIGNRIAKYQMKKLAKMMMCYDPVARKNPFVELGGFIFTFMGDGAPGTGKTTLIQMLCGLLSKYCEVAGREFYYENFSVDQIDSFQGKSGQNTKQFINNVLNPNAIGFGTIDDIDQIAGKRGDKQSSGGAQEVTAVLMEAFAGANTIINGNATFGMLTNYPENVDDALRQRSAARYLVDGPQSEEDYTDLFALLLQSRSNIEVGNTELFSTQQIESAIQTSYEKHNEPETEALKAIFEKAKAKLGKITTFEDFGIYLKMIKDVEPRFTGRAIKNIADAAKLRAMDFELPDEWFENTELFLDKPYDEKLEMIKAMAGEVTPEMLLQELHRYADSEFRYASNSDDASINAIVREHNVREKALTRIKNESNV